MTTTITETILPPKPADFRNIHDIYTVEHEATNTSGEWPKGQVRVYHNAVDGTKTLKFEYIRNYSFYKTFEPFRQLHDGVWRDYALISTTYTTFEVLDLEKGEIIATRPYPQRPLTQAQFEWWSKSYPHLLEEGGKYAGYKPGDLVDGEGFCPVEFYVPDIEEAVYESYWDLSEPEEGKPDYRDMHVEMINEAIKSHAGNTGFYSGCIWGDDSSWKLRGIALSRVNEGIVTDDTRFGYWELPDTREGLRSLIEYDPEYCRISLSVFVNPNTGKASQYTQKDVNWAEDDD